MPKLRVVAALAISCLFPLSSGADPNPDLGRALYDTSCVTCHSTSVHARSTHIAADFRAIREWVAHWSGYLSLDWTAEEIDAVSAYLNNAYYRYPCPAEVCMVLTQAGPQR